MSAKASKAMKGKTTRRAKVKGRKAKKAAAPATSRGASRTSQAKALPQLPPAEQRRWSLFSASRSKPLVPEVLDRDGQAVPKDQAPSVVRYLQGCVTARVRDGGLVQPERFSAAQLDYLHSVGRGHRPMPPPAYAWPSPRGPPVSRWRWRCCRTSPMTPQTLGS